MVLLAVDSLHNQRGQQRLGKSSFPVEAFFIFRSNHALAEELQAAAFGYMQVLQHGVVPDGCENRVHDRFVRD